MAQPLVSVIVPVYNGEQYIDRCLNSLKEQTYENLEIIVIDDGSTDRSRLFIEQFALKDLRVRLIHQENCGVSAARNAGISLASGMYITYLDIDDVFTHRAIELMVQDIRRYHADVVSCMKNVVDLSGSVREPDDNGDIRVYSGLEPLKLHLNRNRQSNSLHAKLFRKEFVDDLRFEEGRKVNEDSFYMFQCYEKKPILVQHNVCVYSYFLTECSASRTAFSEKFLDMLYFCEKKESVISQNYPELITEFRNKEVETRLLFLAVLISCRDLKYQKYEAACLEKIKMYARYFKPRNRFERIMIWAIRCGLYKCVKLMIRVKYYWHCR